MAAGQHANDPVAALLDALRAERSALEAGDSTALPAIVARKSELLRACAALVQGADKARKRALKPRLDEARRMNDQNAKLLIPRLNAVRSRLSVLLRQNNTMVYGADGLARSPFGGGRRGFSA